MRYPLLPVVSLPLLTPSFINMLRLDVHEALWNADLLWLVIQLERKKGKV